VLKNGKASTLDIVQAVKNALPRIQSTLPPQLKVTPLLTSSFCAGVHYGVLREGVIALFLPR